MKEILRKLNISNELTDLIFGKIEIPNNFGDYGDVEEYWYPHPPVLIPIFLNDSLYYYGVLKHFFCDREQVFINYSLEAGYFSELARNDKQFITLIVLSAISIDEELTDEIVGFCNEVNFKKYNEIVEFYNEYGDDNENFNHLVYFFNKLPMKFNKKQIYNACSFEIAKPEYLEGISDLPDWLKNDANQQELFDKYISQNKLKEAWLTLNSTGWKLGDVRKALIVLKTKTDDELFHLVADRWISRFENSTFKADSMY